MSYDTLAPWYESIERLRFGARLQQARTACLEEIPKVRRALFLGDGDGRLLEAFLQRQPECSVMSIDLSRRMLRLQASRASGLDSKSSVALVQADTTDLPVAGPFDLIVTAFHLDCFDQDELPGIVGSLHDLLSPEGVWYVVDFVVPSSRWSRIRAQAWLWLMIQFFRQTTEFDGQYLVDHRVVLRQQGLQIVVEKYDRQGWIHSAIYAKPR